MRDAYKEYYIYTWEDLTGAGMAGGTGTLFDDITVKMDSDADFEAIKRIHSAASDKIRVRFQDDSYGRQLQNNGTQGLDLRGVSGTSLEATGVIDVGISINNFTPYILPRPYLIRAATTFTTSFSDNSGAVNSIRRSMHGAKIRKGQAPWDQEWTAKPTYDYTTGIMSIAAGNTATVTINIQMDAHFLVTKITGARVSGAPGLVTISEGSTGRQWMDKAVWFDNLVGNSQFPNILPAPRLVERGATLTVTIKNISTVNA
jgi:hypothetical protein